MSNRQLLVCVVLAITADNLGELVGGVVANWHRHAEVERVERHGRFLDEVKAKLDERGR